MAPPQFPKWHQELDRFRAFKSTFILEGNVDDQHLYAEPSGEKTQWIPLKLDGYLYKYLLSNGYANIIFYNPIDGFYNGGNPRKPHLADFLRLGKNKSLKAPPAHEEKKDDAEASSQSTEAEEQHSRKNSLFKQALTHPATLGKATEMIRTALENRQSPLVVVMNLASRYVTSPDGLSEEELRVYTRLLLTSLKAVQVKTDTGLLNNLLMIVAHKANDIPAWFYLDNPYVKTLLIAKPDEKQRQIFIESQMKHFPGGKELNEAQREEHKDKFAALTQGMKNLELDGLKVLCQQQNIPITRVAEAISLYKYGIKENPWKELDGKKMEHAEAKIRNRVKGQETAIRQTLDIIKRAVSGMSGLQHSSSSSKPKGILFFAGPTGTGKTELAKTLAEVIFGNENACIRFDMSEYQQSHSDQKLLGAPPGYVGYNAGGQLTNAVKERPFSILLFDEIEKAHPSILDKFLQILEDGRMTDGQGDTVYFSESIIIFTSNLGIYSKDALGQRTPNVNPGMPYKEIQKKVMQGIKDYFVLELGRPEILNRFGNNFVVFNYIQPEVASLILESQLKQIMAHLQEQKEIEVILSAEAHATLLKQAHTNLENGGRGIGSMIETYFLNPLSRTLFDQKIKDSCRLSVNQILEENEIIQLHCEVDYV